MHNIAFCKNDKHLKKMHIFCSKYSQRNAGCKTLMMFSRKFGNEYFQKVISNRTKITEMRYATILKNIV